MHVLSIIRNNRGAGMLMAGLALAALAAGGYMIAEMFMKNDEVLMKDARTLAYRHLVDSVRRNLYAGNACTLALGSAGGAGRSVAGALAIPSGTNGPVGQELTMTMKLGLDDVNLEPGMKFPTGTAIKKIYIQKVEDARNGDDIRLHPSTGAPAILKAAHFRVIIEPDHKGVNVWNKDKDGNYIHEDLFINIFAYYNPVDNQIYSCFDPASDATYCTEIQKGAYWHDPGTEPQLRCQPDRVCFNYKGGILAPGEACPAPYTMTAVGGGGNAYPSSAGGATAGGLKMCSWCHPIPRAYSAADVLSFNVTADGGDIEGTCSAAGYTDMSQIESYQMYQDGIDSSVFAGAGASQDPNLASAATACQSTPPSCQDSWDVSPYDNSPPNGDWFFTGIYYQGNIAFGGTDGNRCRHDCTGAPKNNHEKGCNNGALCLPDLPGTASDPLNCINECTNGRHVRPGGSCGYDDLCTPQDECCVDDPSTLCKDECSGFVVPDCTEP